MLDLAETPDLAKPEHKPKQADPAEMGGLSDQQRADIKAMQGAGYVAEWDGKRLLCHSKGFEVLNRPGYRCNSAGTHPGDPNAFAYATEDDGWVVTRFGVRPEAEAPGWYPNAQGFATARIAAPFDDLLEMSAPPEETPATTKKRLEIPLITSADLDGNRYETSWLIKDVLVEAQPCMFAGPKKGMKTSLLIALAIALATGLRFLGHLVIRPVKVVILSGESGMATLQETARRICKSMGLRLADIGNLLWSDFLPRLDDPEHLAALERMIRETGCKVLIVDPAYLCMPGADAANVFVQGALLRRVGEICQRHGVALILAHHTRKQSKTRSSTDYQPPELDDMAWAGFAEYARQWFLIGRREAYTPGTGEHRLWVTIGGSAGHSAQWAVDIEEGVSGEPRRWEVSLSTPSDARAEKKFGNIRQRILDAASEFPQGETKTAILETAKVRSDIATRNVFDSLVEEGKLLPIKVRKHSATHPGFKLAPQETAA